jgi:type I restriction-modification system DNA methylase subunit
MGLYQKSVLKKYLDSLDDYRLNIAFDEYSSYFYNPITQQNIRKAKEEQYQEGFLRELFVKIMGYTINPDPGFNLITEQKNVSDSKKADGAIIINETVIGVIELKGTNTIDLGKIQQQAFYYLSAHPEAVYVVTSNFEKLRFYIQKSNEYEEFNLFALTLEEFKFLYLCISHESVSNGVPLKIKQESVIKEESITKQLYKDYSNFKNDLYQSLCDRNPNLDKLTLFKASQKLIDRFLFILFCEDNNGLLPANSISEIIKHWNKLREMDEYKPLYDIFKKYFEYINTGRTASGDKQEIFAFNGGLFSTDTFLDQLLIEDNILYTHTQKLSTYDFISEVDVNILGHIFEHSLNEIEEIQAELEGNPVDKSKTKRKKDGVFYTPKYITEYIVENTVGKLCMDKKTELGIDEDQFVNAKSTKERKPLQDQLSSYKQYVLSLTICDPACGSGAFLNQAFVYLQKEHYYIADLESKLFDAPIGMVDVSADILENNLFGVDINEESVEIAKLSLWLRSAKKGRKLNNLSKNIKCGNSLIDDPDVAGDKAFRWEEEFPQVFAKGGFDVVIGNPPYVQLQKMKKISDTIKSIGYKTYEKTGDLYCLFYEKGNIILKNNGLLGYITSNKWMRANYGASLRKYLIDFTQPTLIIDLGSNVFESATVDSNILILKKTLEIGLPFRALNIVNQKEIPDKINFNNVGIKINPKEDQMWVLSSDVTQIIKSKIEEKGIKLKHWGINIYYGIKTGCNEAFIIDDVTRNSIILKDPKSIELLKPILRGRDIGRYWYNYSNLWLINTHNGYNDKERVNVENYPAIKEHLDIYWNKISERYDKGDTPYNLRNCAYLDDFEETNIFYPDISQRLSFTKVKSNFFCNNTGYFLRTENEYLLSILNSKLINYYYSFISSQLGNTGIRNFTIFIENIPIPKVDNKFLFAKIANKMLDLNKSLHEKQSKFISRIQSNFQIDNISGKLEKFYEYDFKTFLGELRKQKVTLSLKDQDEWEDYFNTYKQDINTLQAEIAATDKEIDQMVYELYGLTEEEIKVVEGSN